MIERQAILASARSFVGTPFRHQGRSKGSAIDCLGFIWGVAREVGYVVDIPSVYAPVPRGDLIARGVQDKLVLQDRQELLVGDVLLMFGLQSGSAQHFCIVGEWGGTTTILHALRRHNGVVEHTLDRPWLRRVMAIYNFPGTEPA